MPSASSTPRAGGRVLRDARSILCRRDGQSRRGDRAHHDGHMLDDLLGDDKDARYGWFWQLKALPDSPQSRYLYALLADNDFQEGLKNYRDWRSCSRTLRHWDDSMEAFAAMIDTRAARLRRAAAATPMRCWLAMRRRNCVTRARRSMRSCNAIETGHDVAALGTPHGARAVVEQLARCSRSAGERCRRVSNAEQTRDKLRLMKGVLYWRLDADFKARSYAAAARAARGRCRARGAAEPLGAGAAGARQGRDQHRRVRRADRRTGRARRRPCEIDWRKPRSSRTSTCRTWPNQS